MGSKQGAMAREDFSMSEKKPPEKPKRIVFNEFHYVDGDKNPKVALTDFLHPSPEETDEMHRLSEYWRGKATDTSSK